MDLTLVTDSVHVKVFDKRLVKSETKDLDIAVTSTDINILIEVTWKGNYRNIKYGATIPCQECYDDLKRKCKYK